jgi:hypothetical protein
MRRYDTTVPRLVLVLPDLYPARLSDGARAALPRLPALERWLARGSIAAVDQDWRRWLLREYCAGRHAGAALASVAAVAVAGVPAQAQRWLATPIHYVAGLDTLRVHPAGLLVLSDSEQQALAADFAQVFRGSGWMLHATGRRELLLSGGADLEVQSTDPARWLGTALAEGLPTGAGASELRRLASELEMWLHEHPVNQARERRGELVASGLWLWGGGGPLAIVAEAAAPGAPGAPAAAVAKLPKACAADLFVDGLWQLAGAVPAPVPVRLAAGQGAAGEGDTLVICELGSAPDPGTLERIERDWLAPALVQWQAGAWQSITLLAGTRVVTLQRDAGFMRWFEVSFWRALRRPRPWWETLLEC